MPTLTTAQMADLIRAGRVRPQIGGDGPAWLIGSAIYIWDVASGCFLSPF